MTSGRVVIGLVGYHYIFLLDFTFLQTKSGNTKQNMVRSQFYICSKHALNYIFFDVYIPLMLYLSLCIQQIYQDDDDDDKTNTISCEDNIVL